MFSKARLDSLSDGIFGVAMTLLILDARPAGRFFCLGRRQTAAGRCRSVAEIPPYVLSFGVLGLRWLANIEVRTRAEYFNRAYVDGWLPHHFLITCVPFTTIVVGRFGHFAPAVWLYAGHIAAVGLRPVAITPHLEQGDHLRHRQLSAMSLIASWLLAAAPQFQLSQGENVTILNLNG